MTREEAIEAITRLNIINFRSGKTYLTEALTMAIEALRTQLKESPDNVNKDSATESMLNADLISRQAVLDKAKYWIAMQETKTGFIERRGYFVDVDDVKALPSVHSEQEVDMNERTEGIVRQAQELIEQAYKRGFKAGFNEGASHPSIDDIDKWIEQGRNEAWNAAKKIMSQNGASWGMKDMKEIFGWSYSTDIMLDLSASEAIEKIRAYEERKKHEDDEEIKVGDEVLINEDFKAVALRTKMDNSDNYCFIVCPDGSGGKWKKSELKKTGRTFPEIAEVLKKLQEAEEG